MLLERNTKVTVVLPSYPSATEQFAAEELINTFGCHWESTPISQKKSKKTAIIFFLAVLKETVASWHMLRKQNSQKD